MNYDDFLELLNKNCFPQAFLVKHVGDKFLDFQSHPSELLAFVIDGQVDITIDGHRASYLAGDCFRIPANQVHSKSFGGKGVSYAMSFKDESEGVQVPPQT